MNIRHVILLAPFFFNAAGVLAGPTLLGPANVSILSFSSAGGPNLAGTRYTFDVADTSELEIVKVTFLDGFEDDNTPLSGPLSLVPANTTIVDEFTINGPDFFTAPVSFTVWHPDAASGGTNIDLNMPVTHVRVEVKHLVSGTGIAGNGDVDFSVTSQNFFFPPRLEVNESISFAPAEVVDINPGPDLVENWSTVLTPFSTINGERAAGPFLAVTPTVQDFGIQQVPEPSAALFGAVLCCFTGFRQWRSGRRTFAQGRHGRSTV